MLIISPTDWFDNNNFGICLALFFLFFVPFFLVHWVLIGFIEFCLICSIYWLYNSIKNYKSTSILISKENNWVLEYNNQQYSVEICDYWILTGYLFIWLKGSEKSLSFVVSRSIIGERHFSQLRTKII